MRNRSTDVRLSLKQHRVLYGVINNGLADGDYERAYLSPEEKVSLTAALKKLTAAREKAESYENVCSIEGCENDAIDSRGPSVCWEHSHPQ